MLPLRACLLVAALLLAGCAAGPAGSLDEQPPPVAGAGGLPPGCDPARLAVAHRAGGVPAAAAASVGVGCLLDTGASSSEPTLGVSPDTGAVFFFPALSGTGSFQPEGTAVMRSTDEGATWTRHAPAIAGQPTHRVELDPFFYLDPATGRIFADDLTTVNCSMMAWSDDEGETWTDTVAGCMETDHQTIFAGPPRISATVGYPNIVYRCAMNTVALAGASTTTTCQRSLDGGASWLPPGEPAFVGVSAENAQYCDGATGHGTTDAKGRVYLPKGLCGEPWLAMSDDEGLTWTRVRVSDLGMHRSASGYPGHDAGVGVDAAGNVHYFWIAEDRLPYLVVSRDGGATWSEPRMVGVPGLREASMPALVAGGAGKLAFLYMGSTSSPGAPFPVTECDQLVCIGDAPQPPGYESVTWNGYIGVTTDALAGDPLFLTVSVNDPADPLVRGACGAGTCQGVWDFLDVTLGPDGTPWGAFVDTCVGGCVSSTGTQDNAERGLVGRFWGVDLR